MAEAKKHGSKHALQVGQKLWYVPHPMLRRSDSHWVTIEKVGRRWITLADNKGRIDKDTLFMDGDKYTPGRCWLSKQDWADDCATNLLWREFIHGLSIYNPPDGLTVDTIRQAADVLGIDLPALSDNGGETT